MDMVLFAFRFVVMLLAVQMHQVKLIDQAMLLQQFESPVNGGTVNAGISCTSQSEQRGGIQMLLG